MSGEAPLRCPSCLGPLEAGSGGSLHCAGGHAFPVRDGIPRFVAVEASRAEQKTRRAFEVEWQAFGGEGRLYGGTPEESMALLFEEMARPEIDPGWLRGKRVLDAGCGHGRYVRGLAALGAEAWGLDLGAGIEVAAERCRGVEASLVQGSLLEPPFSPGSFDLVISKGVIHCTPDPEGAARRLAQLVRPGGFLFLWVYPRYAPWFLRTQEAVRQVTKRMPPRALIPLCYAAVPLLAPVLRRGVGVPTHASSSRRSFGRTSWRERAQMIYDWLSPWYQSYHDPEEVAGWLAENGFEDIRPCPIPSGASGRKSVRPRDHGRAS